MELLTVDQTSCKQDGLCAAVCPMGLIDFNRGSFPQAIDGADELCVRCGHCLAVCPSGSLNHRDMDVAGCRLIRNDLQLSAGQCEQFLKGRRSIRAYKDRQVSRETMEKVLDMARYAPSGHNSQGVKWLVIGRRQELRELSALVVEWMRLMLENSPDFAHSLHLDRTVTRWEKGEDVILRGAPSVVVAHAPKDDRMAPVSCTIGLTYLELAATGLGLGCCWAGYFNAAASTFAGMQEALALPEGHRSFGAMMIGYPKFQYMRLPERRQPEVSWRME